MENFSLIRGSRENSKDRWDLVCLEIKYLELEERTTDFRVYTIKDGTYLPLELRYNQTASNHDLIIDDNLFDLKLCGAPIIAGEKYFVGVLMKDPDHPGKFIPCFISKGVLEHRRERSFIDGPVGYTRKEMAEELERHKDEATENLPGGYVEESMAGPSGKYREESMAETPDAYREESMEKAPGGYRGKAEAFSVAEVPGRYRERLEDEAPKGFKEERVAEAPTGKYKEDPVAEPSGRHKEEPAVEEPPGRYREQPVAGAPERNKEEAKRTFEADMTFSDGSRHWDVSLRVAGNSWTDDTAWAQQYNKAVEELGRNAVTVVLESSGRQVINMRPIKSVLVELRCYTKESFLSFMADLESGKVKRRLEEEFAKVGYKGELEVTIINEKDVYRALDQIRAQMAMTKSMGVVGEVPVTLADSPKKDVASSTVSTVREDTKTMCVLMEDDIPLGGPRNVRDQSEEASGVSVADLPIMHESNQGI
ncbi:hypothetical protein ABFA07_009804 [Porites harrisoni]